LKKLLSNSDLSISGELQHGTGLQSIAGPPEWDALSPGFVFKCYNLVLSDTIRANRVHDFYKSYPSWAYMMED
jgi:hypothetical protein